MFQDIFVIGATGKVGRTLLQQIFEKGDVDHTKHQNPTRVIGISSSAYVLLAPPASDLRQEHIQHFLEHPASGQKYHSLRQLVALTGVTQGERKNLAFVDVTAVGPEMLDFHTHVVKDTPYGLVTANKLPLVLADFKTFHELTAHAGVYGFRCAVMAGAEAVNKVRDLVDLGDRPTEISGCFSGTLGYITSELATGKPFSEIVKAARNEGYTEPHPAEDLSGLDVERKILILARAAGYDVSNQHIHCEPFVPRQYLAERNVNVFCERLERLDDYFEKRVADTARKGAVLRYTATFYRESEKPRIRVGLEEVAKDSPLGLLGGTRNKIVIRTQTYGRDFYSVEAPGAGLEVAAQNIRRDLLDQIPQRVVCSV